MSGDLRGLQVSYSHPGTGSCSCDLPSGRRVLITFKLGFQCGEGKATNQLVGWLPFRVLYD